MKIRHSFNINLIIRNFFLLILPLIAFFGCSQKPEPELDKVYAKESLKRLEKDILGIKQTDSGKILDILNDPDKSSIDFTKLDEPGWVTVRDSLTFDGSISPDAAREQLLTKLRNRAVKKKVGTEVEIITLLTDVMVSENNESYENSVWSGFFKSTVSGLIIDENYKDKMTPIHDGYRMVIRLNAYIIPVTGRRDPGYFIDAEIESNMLKNGDEIHLSVRPSKDSYLYVLNLMADNNAMVIYPNKYMKDNFIQGGQQITIPDKSLQGKLRLRVGLIPGEKFISESIYVICTKDKVPSLHQLPSISEELKILPRSSDDFIELQQWLSKIPLNRRIEKVMLYHISE